MTIEEADRISGWSEEAICLPSDHVSLCSACIFERFNDGIAKGSPAIMLDDQARNDLLLFAQPERIIATDSLSHIDSALEDARLQADAGKFVVGYISYGASPAFDTFHLHAGTSQAVATTAAKLWLGVFNRCYRGAIRARPVTTARLLLTPAIGRQAYEAAVQSVLERIEAGEIYQANLTFPTTFSLADPLDNYLSLRQRAAAPFGAIMWNGQTCLQSFSPELFFSLNDRQLKARPMKGTRPRSSDHSLDQTMRENLRVSEKDRAENLMILDLLRNDLSKVSVAGSVKCPQIFTVERYPSVWQLTSTVTSQLLSGVSGVDVLRRLFPSGSVVGAPKIQASKVIAETEQHARGIYTGSFLLMSKRSTVANVAIRTMDLHQSNCEWSGRLDIGAGIVADSNPAAEWEECKAKARFAGELVSD